MVMHFPAVKCRELTPGKQWQRNLFCAPAQVQFSVRDELCGIFALFAAWAPLRRGGKAAYLGPVSRRGRAVFEA
jgi:hypothetical protein